MSKSFDTRVSRNIIVLFLEGTIGLLFVIVCTVSLLYFCNFFCAGTSPLAGNSASGGACECQRKET